jgi:hypothetical protein
MDHKVPRYELLTNPPQRNAFNILGNVKLRGHLQDLSVDGWEENIKVDLTGFGNGDME